jgi:hypothetical protein
MKRPRGWNAAAWPIAKKYSSANGLLLAWLAQVR